LGFAAFAKSKFFCVFSFLVANSYVYFQVLASKIKTVKTQQGIKTKNKKNGLSFVFKAHHQEKNKITNGCFSQVSQRIDGLICISLFQCIAHPPFPPILAHC
jgi:hypothetical protein